jgi:hypothetical protein
VSGTIVLGHHAALLADAGAEADRVIAFARADIGDGHALLDPGQVHHLGGFVEPVARFLGRPARRQDRGDRAIGGGEAVIAGGGGALLLVARHRRAAAGGEGERQQ